MLESLREETEGKLQMLLSLRKNGLTSLFKEVRAFEDFLTGPNFTDPQPPTPENSLLGVGGLYKRGGVKEFLLRGASKYAPPSPLP